MSSGERLSRGRGNAREPLPDLLYAVMHEQESLLDARRRERLEGPGEEGNVEEREETLLRG